MNVLPTPVKKYQLVMLLISGAVYLATILSNSCKGRDAVTITHANGKQFAGDASCKNCHANIYKSHQLTAHFATSQPATAQSIKGSFEAGKNTFSLTPSMRIEMQRSNDSFFQAGYIDTMLVARKPFDIVIGSGTKGQSYLFWDTNKLYQLPVSYSVPLNSWCNSPGYPLYQLIFDRVIPGRCLECHSTNFKKLPGEDGVNAYDKSQIIYGISCERCHGPSAEHVAYQEKNPAEKKAKFVINPRLLSRQQKLDNCALCHSGVRQNSQPAFSYLIGDKLDDYSTPDYKPDGTTKLDVHGNQYGLLTASKCFKMSKMDCSSCHNVHEKQRNNAAYFSQKCMACHSKEQHNFCTKPVTNGLVLENNCIDCHMPQTPSKTIFINVADRSKSSADSVRNHLIAVYNKTKKVGDKKD